MPGFVSGNSVISIRNAADVLELWSKILKADKAVLWCDGLNLNPSDGDGNCTRGEERPCSKYTLERLKLRLHGMFKPVQDPD